MLKVKFVSQRHRPFSEIGCGVASTMMLLKCHYLSPKLLPTYKQLAHALRVNIPAKKKGKEWDGVYLKDITSYFASKQIKYISTEHGTGKQFSGIKDRIARSPIIVGMRDENKWGEAGHWIVLIRYQDETFTYLDPYKKTLEKHKNKIKIEDFLREWDGKSIQIVT